MWFPPGVYTARMSFVYLFILRLYSRRPWTVVYDLNPNNLRKKVFSPVPRRRRPLNVLFTMQQQRERMTKQQQKYRKVADADDVEGNLKHTKYKLYARLMEIKFRFAMVSIQFKYT